MTGRCEWDVIKVDVPDLAPVYLHVDRWRHSAPTFWISSPGKYRDKALGDLLEKIMEEVNGALR